MTQPNFAFLDGKTVEDTFRLRGRAFYNGAIPHLFHDESAPAVGTRLALIARDNPVGSLFGMRCSPVALMARDAAPFLARCLL